MVNEVPGVVVLIEVDVKEFVADVLLSNEREVSDLIGKRPLTL